MNAALAGASTFANGTFFQRASAEPAWAGSSKRKAPFAVADRACLALSVEVRSVQGKEIRGGRGYGGTAFRCSRSGPARRSRIEFLAQSYALNLSPGIGDTS